MTNEKVYGEKMSVADWNGEVELEATAERVSNGLDGQGTCGVCKDAIVTLYYGTRSKTAGSYGSSSR